MPTTHSTRLARVLTLVRDLRDILVSLKTTIVLLVFSVVLVFAATLDQVNLGIWAVQEKYFRAFVVYTLVGDFAVPAFPGGYTVGGLLLLNLVGAHVYRFHFSWRKSGIWLTHIGLIVLLVGELLTGLWQRDYHLRLSEGETKNYSESFRHFELALVDTGSADFDEVVAVPDALLARKVPVQHPKLPFRVEVRTFYANSTLQTRTSSADAAGAAGMNDHLMAAPLPITYRSNESNIPSAVIELVGPEGRIGTYLVSGHLAQPQQFAYAGRTWRIGLRLERAYHPFSLTLLKFSHDRYAGTEIPKNFSSRLHLKTENGRDDRDVLIYMNNPLRHAGLTLYQAGFENNDRTTILQVVRNPSWLLPYIACTLMTLGLMVQFGIHAVGFARKRAAVSAKASAAPATSATSPKPALPQVA